MSKAHSEKALELRVATLYQVARGDIPQGRVDAIVLDANQPLDILTLQYFAALHERGCRLFVSVGRHAEQVHDSLDECLYASVNTTSVMTTFHIDELPEDIAALIVEVATKNNFKRVLFIMDPGSDLGRVLRATGAACAQR